jgi:hypothetical protein
LRPFEGDIAVQDLRRRLSLNPNLVPQPPAPEPGKPLFPWIGRLSFLALAAATVAGFTVLMNSQEANRHIGARTGASPRLEGSIRGGTSSQPVKMIVESQRTFANEPLPLGVWLDDASGGETVTMGGLASGTKLSAGTPLGATAWQVSARDLSKAFAFAPKDFVGVMNAVIDLRSRDRLVDSQSVRLEWLPKKESHPEPAPEASKGAAAINPLDPQEIAKLIQRGEDFVKKGDIPSARIALRRAASAGDAQASLALGMTFDPVFLGEQGVLGFASDVAQARSWYEKATQLGSAEASRRLARLANIQ